MRLMKEGMRWYVGVVLYTRNTHSQRASQKYYYAHVHKRIAQLCTRMSIHDIPDHDGHVLTYIMRIDPSFRASR